MLHGVLYRPWTLVAVLIAGGVGVRIDDERNIYPFAIFSTGETGWIIRIHIAIDCIKAARATAGCVVGVYNSYC